MFSDLQLGYFGEAIPRCLRIFGSLKGGMLVWLEAEGPPLGLPFTAGIGMSIKGETERLEIGEIQLGNRWKYKLEIDGNTTLKKVEIQL